jgi:starch-binding outer membrane protein, SusD/RagB family
MLLFRSMKKLLTLNYFKSKAGLLFAALLLSTSCDDFLEKKPQGQLLQTSFPVSASDALLATNAGYASLRNWFYHSGGFPILDIMSDDARKGSSIADGFSTVGPYDNFTINRQQDGLDRWWAALYQGIRTANIVIASVPGIAMDENLKNRYIGEAKFLRGIFYFDLVRAWGGVPLVTTPTPALDLARATKDSSLVI